jgi:hypothetical protein
LIDESNDSNKLYWTLGYEAGIDLERERIIKVMKDLAATRDILQTLSYPFLVEEIEAAINEGQDD